MGLDPDFKRKAKTGKNPVLAFPVNRGFGVVHNYIFVL
jgi:hypothetical protein